MHKKGLKTIYFLWHLLRIVYILLCLITFMKLVTPTINQYYFAQENFVTKAADKLHVEDVSLRWQGLFPSLVLHDISLAKIPHDKIEHVSKMFAVVDVWKSLVKWKLDLSNIIINDIVLNLDSTVPSAPKIQDINNLHHMLAAICYENLNFYLENVSVKNLTVKYQNSKHVVKLSKIKYTSFSNKDKLDLTLDSLDNENIAASAELLNYKDQLGSVISANYSFKANGKYPDYITQKLQSKFKLQQLSGKLDVNYNWYKDTDPAIVISHNITVKVHNSITFNNIKGKLHAVYKSHNNYSVKGDVGKLNFNDHSLGGLKYELKINSDDGDDLRLQHLDLASLKDLAPLFIANKNITTWLKEVGPRGIVNDLYLSGYGFMTSPIIKVTRANIAGLKLAPWHNYPGIDALDIKLKYLDGIGDAIVHSKNKDISLDLPEIFAKKLRVQTEGLHVKFSRGVDSKWQVLLPNAMWSYNGNDISSDISINAGGGFKALFNMKEANILSLQELLAAKPLNAKLRKWLKSSITAGVLEDATLELAIGDINNFTFKGKFDKASLSFASDWPQLENIKGKIYLDNDRMEVLSTNAEMKTQNFDSLKVSILDLHHPSVTVAAGSKVDLAKAKTIIDASPLRKTLGKYFSGADMAGNTELQLAFKLNHAVHFAAEDVIGEVLLDKNTLSWPKLNFGLTNASGKLSFHNFDITSSNLEALYHQDKVSLITTSDSEGLHVDMKGMLDANAIAAEYLPATIAKNIAGKSAFAAGLDITAGNTLAGKLHVSTDAFGISVNYPKPFSKKQDLERPVDFDASFTAKEISYKFNIAPNIKFVAASDAAKPVKAIDVYLDSLNMDDWFKYFDNSHKVDTPNLNIFAKTLNFNKEVFEDIKISMLKKSKSFMIRLYSKKIKGDFVYLPDNNLKVDLDYLNLSEYFASNFDHAGKDDYLYDIAIKKLLFAGREVKDIKATIDNEGENEYKIKELKFTHKNSDFNIKGNLDTGDNPKSTLEGRVNSDNFSEVFAYIPSFHNFDNGNGEIKFYITWPDLINKFSPKLASAMFDISVFDGELVDIGEKASKDLKASKALNFLSMKNIIQNLSSNDESDQSYLFDEIKGNLIYSQGVLNTDKIELQGDFGSAYVKGDINLKSYSYDLYMTIMPIITSSIPTIAALAGGVLAGVVAWTANQLVEDPISEIAKKVYKISGPMENPRVVELGTEDLPAEAITT